VVHFCALSLQSVGAAIILGGHTVAPPRQRSFRSRHRGPLVLYSGFGRISTGGRSPLSCLRVASLACSNLSSVYNSKPPPPYSISGSGWREFRLLHSVMITLRALALTLQPWRRSVGPNILHNTMRHKTRQIARKHRTNTANNAHNRGG
jgi:hypothetical protein